MLARAQAGPALDDERLLSEVREEFSARAARLPLAEWPLRYWGLLLARDELGRPSGQTPAHPIYSLTHTRRLALLLRLVVGLEPAGAARVMGLSETAYRALWADAEDKLAEKGVGPAVLMRWHEAFQREARGEVVEGRFVSLDKAEIVEASMKGKQAHVTVRFISQMISVTKGRNGEIIDGSPDKITEVTDQWTFARDTTISDPNWRLVATDEGA